MNTGSKRLFWPVLLPLLFPALVFCALALLIFSTAENLPVWDAWHFVSELEKHHKGTLEFSDLFAVVNGHRLLFPKIFMLLLADLTQWDLRYELLINLAFAALGFLVYYALIIKSLQSMAARLFSGALFALLYFSLVQFENWYWGWQMALFMASSLVIFCLATLGISQRWPALLLAALAAGIASFSFSNALLVFPVGFLLLLLKRAPALILVFWLAAGIFIGSLFLYDYPDAQTSLQADKLSAYLQYVLIYLGSPFAGDNLKLAFYTGIGGIFLFILLSWTTFTISHQHISLIYFSIALFVLLSACLTAIARLRFGLDGALLSRYTTFSVQFWIALAGLCFLPFGAIKPLSRRAIQIPCLVILLSMAPAIAYNSWQAHDEFALHQKRTRLAMQELKAHGTRAINPNLVRNVGWNNRFTLKQNQCLRKLGLTFYAETPASATKP